MAELFSNLQDPNLHKLALSLGRANFTELADVLSKEKVDIEDLMNALRKHELLEDTEVSLEWFEWDQPNIIYPL